MLAFYAGVVIWLQPTEFIVVELAVIVAITVVCLLIRKPVWGVCFALIAAPFKPLEQELFRLPLDSGQALLALALVSYILRDLVTRPWSLRASPTFVHGHRGTLLAIALFCAFAFFSFFQTTDGSAWLRESLKWVEIVVIYLIIANESVVNRRWVFASIFVCLFVQGVLGLLQFTRIATAPWHFAILDGRYYRAFGTLQQPNPYGGLMGMMWTFAAGVFIYALSKIPFNKSDISKMRYEWFKLGDQTWLKKAQIVLKIYKPHRYECTVAIIGLIGTLIALGGLVASWSRGAWLASGVAAVGMLIVALRKPGRTFVVLALSITIIYLFNLFAYLPASVRDRLTGFTSQFSSLDIDVRYVVVNPNNFATIERLAHWQAAQEMIMRHTWFGVGFGNYEAAYQAVRVEFWRNALGHAHNYYLNIFAETGVFGLMAYIVMWLYIIMRTAHIARTNALAIGIVGVWLHIAMHNIVDNLYVANMFMFIGAFLGLIENYTSSSSRHQPYQSFIIRKSSNVS